jgi:serine phosphatase RsbU (regulator of sigma subunit)
MFAETGYRPQRLDLLPGDRLVLFTDGITESTPEGGTSFGQARLVELLLATRSVPPGETVRLVANEVLAHRAGQLDDDASIVVLDWTGTA